MRATFGCLDNAVLELKPGLNLLTLPNGGGKSTWCAFLLAMLYGLETTRRTSRTALSDKDRYVPWSSAPMAGRMDLEWNGQPVTIERTSQGKGLFNVFRAYDSRTGRDIPNLTAETCGQTLLGAERSVYARSGFIGQNAMAITGDPALEQRLSALVSSGEESVSRSAAEQALRTYKNRLQHNQTGRIPTLEQELGEIERTLSLLTQGEEDLRRLELEHTSLLEQLAEAKRRTAVEAGQARRTLLARLEAAQQQAEAASMALRQGRTKADLLPDAQDIRLLEQALEQLAKEEAQGPPEPLTRRNTVSWALFGILTATAAAVSAIFWPMGLAAAAVPVLWLLWYLRWRPSEDPAAGWRAELDARRDTLMAQANDIAPCDTVTEARDILRRALALPAEVERLEGLEAAARTAADALQAAVQAGDDIPPDQAGPVQAALRDNETAQARLRGALDATGSRDALQSRRDTLTTQLDALRQKQQAVILAMEALEKAANQLETRFAPRVSQRAAALFCRLTDGQYDRVLLDRDMRLQAGSNADMPLRSPLALSGGTADQLYLSVRLAIADLTIPDTPLVLDDALTAFDDERLAEALALLSELGETRQILLFSCTKREQVILNFRQSGGNLM